MFKVGYIYECSCSCGLICEILEINPQNVLVKSLTKCVIAEKDEVFEESFSTVKDKLYYSNTYNSKLHKALL